MGRRRTACLYQVVAQTSPQSERAHERHCQLLVAIHNGSQPRDGIVLERSKQKPGFWRGPVLIRINTLPSEQGIDPALDVRREIAGIAPLQLLNTPIVSTHTSPAVDGAALTIKFIIRRGIAHGIVEADFFARLNVPQGDQRDLSRKPGVWITRVVDIIALPDPLGNQEKVFLHLNTQAALPVRQGGEALHLVDNAPENSNEFAPLYRFQGENAVPVPVGFRAALQFGGQVRAWLGGHTEILRLNIVQRSSRCSTPRRTPTHE